MGKGTLASSLGIEILTMGFGMVGKGNGTSCALIHPSIGAKVEKGSLSGAGGALGIGRVLALRVLALVASSKLFGTTPSTLGCVEVATLGASSRIGNPCQVKSCTSRSSIGS